MDKRKGEENIRIEYSAICANLNQLASFRFNLIGFYVAAMGLIVSAKANKYNFILMILISICFWIIELRNRGLHTNITESGREIETKSWGYEGFICSWSKQKTKPNLDKVKTIIGERSLPNFLSHSVGLDLLFISVIIYSIINLFRCH